MKQLSDCDRAVLFLYLIKDGLPPWAYGDNQPKALALIAGWDEERAKRALEQSVKAGYAEEIK